MTTAELKAAYQKGLTQGGKMIARDYADETKSNAHPSQEQLRALVKKWMQERDDSVQSMVQNRGLNSEYTMRSFGWHNGMKAWIKDHGLPQP